MTDPISVKTSVKCVVPLWLLRFSFIQLSSLRPQTCSVNVRTCKASAVKLNSSTWSKYIIDDTAESRGCRRWTIRGKLSSCSRKQRRIVNPNLNPISSSPGTDIDPEVDFIWIAVRLRGVVLSVPNSSRGSHSCFLAYSAASYATVFIPQRCMCLLVSGCLTLICEMHVGREHVPVGRLDSFFRPGGWHFVPSSPFAVKQWVSNGKYCSWIWVWWMPNKDIFTVSHCSHRNNLNHFLE